MKKKLMSEWGNLFKFAEEYTPLIKGQERIRHPMQTLHLKNWTQCKQTLRQHQLKGSQSKIYLKTICL